MSAPLYRIGERLLRPPVTALWRVTGARWERITADGPAVLAPNHDSLLDGLFVGMATRRVVHWMGKAELWRIPLVKQVMGGLGCFPVRRDEGDETAIVRGRALLDRGELVGVFPQGTCLPYRDRPWRRGAARLVLEMGVPLLPIAVVHGEGALRPHRLRLGFPQVLVLVGEPVEAAGNGHGPEAAGRLIAEVERRVGELRRPFGPPAHVWIDGPAGRR